MSHPLYSLSGLTAAVVGGDGAGKSSLVTALIECSGSQTPPPVPSPSPPSPPAPLARVLRSTPLRIIQRQLTRLRQNIRQARERDSCVSHVLPTGDDRPPLILLEATSGAGVSAVSAAAGGRHIDIVLFVTRLDEGRVTADDRIVLALIGRAFGASILDRTLFVFTHGCATPPHNLSFDQFVRGRRDVLWGHIMDLVPPTPLGTPHVIVEPSCRDPIVAPVPSDLFTDPGVVFDFKHRAPWARRASSREDGESTQGQDGRANSTDTQPLSIGERIRNVDLTLSPTEQFFALDVPIPGEDPAEFATYREAPPPVVTVVELSGLCPIDDDGERILPDETAWMPVLIGCIAERAVRVSSDAVIPLQLSRRRVGPWMGIRGALAGIGEFVACNAIAGILVEMMLGSLLTSGITRVNNAVMDAKKRRSARDIVVGISDEEFEKLSREDPDEGMAVLSLDGSDSAEDEVKLEKEELFGSLKDAEQDFFGGPMEHSVEPRAGDSVQGGDWNDESDNEITP